MRTKEEMLNAAKELESQEAVLPMMDAFGDDNTDAKAEMLEWARQLRKAAKGTNPTNSDVKDWVAGKWSPIKDCVG